MGKLPFAQRGQGSISSAAVARIVARDFFSSASSRPLLHVAMLKLHCNLSEMERIAGEALQSGENLAPTETAYHTAVLS
mgnify:CR=1 FL=1